ncbi:plasmid partitioning protein RepA [Roseibium sp. RKSG952]|nr:plasmid partitioning protein RepA [Roseibium sp. RKSG952]MTH95041.1 plasmid partitioning protein RepA [Roseibium sp. RKSG952]
MLDKIEPFTLDDKILQHGEEISQMLDQLRRQTFPPDAQKTLRKFPLKEVASFIGTTPENLKRLYLNEKGPVPEIGRRDQRYYDAEQIEELREYLNETGRSASKPYVPRKRSHEKLQVIAVVNFKGGSGKTTTAAHLGQHLSLTGHRTLGIDLDPQGSLSALHGFQPELDNNPSIYDAIRYDNERQDIATAIRDTNFPMLKIIPANLDLQEFEYATPLAMQTSAEGKRFFARIADQLETIEEHFDVVIMDCPPQLGYLTLASLSAATSVLITVHPQMLDLMSMSQFLLMLGSITRNLRDAGVPVQMDWMRYLITRYEPTDVPQRRMVGFLESILAEEVLNSPMLKSTAISDAGLTKRSLYELERGAIKGSVYDRAMECMLKVNNEIQDLIHKTWGR